MFVPTLGAAIIILRNAVMVGVFHYFFYQKGLFFTMFTTVWIHGTLELSAIVIAGGAGMLIGHSILFPGTYSRGDSLRIAGKKGLKVIVGLIPVFIMAGLLESFVTRYEFMPSIIKIMIIALSALFIIYYFIIYPLKLKRINDKGAN